MRRFLSSPRRRRRAGWLAAMLAAAGIALVVGLLYPNTGHNSSVFTRGKPKVVHEEPASTPLPKGDRLASQRILDDFILTAVLRRHLSHSYDLVTPNLRSGMKRVEWLSGDIPVVPYPAKDFGFAKSKLRYSHGNVARYDVLIWARPHAQTGSIVFSMELHAVGSGSKRHWLVDYWEPLGGGVATATPTQGTNPLSLRVNQPEASTQPLGTTWVLAPLAILSLIVLVPTGLGVRGWVRNRRADREYAKTLPPLPPRS